MKTLRTLTIALVCATAQAGYSISSMLTTRRKKTPGSGSLRGAAPADGPSEEIEALAGESFDWLANLGAPAALVQQTLHLAARREHAADAVAGLGRGAD